MKQIKLDLIFDTQSIQMVALKDTTLFVANLCGLRASLVYATQAKLKATSSAPVKMLLMLLQPSPDSEDIFEQV